LSVTRAGGSTGSATVTYVVKAGTTAAGSDFVEVAGSQLSFADGVTSKTFTVQIKDDTLAEGTETVLLELKNPTGDATLGTPSTATLNILDNEAPSSVGSSTSSSSSSSSTSSVNGAGTLGFSAAGYEVSEDIVTATFTVVRTNGSTGQVGVNYATTDKTAKAGSEYATTTGTLTFAAGETSKTFKVPIIDDAAYPVVDGKKTFTLTLSAPTGGAALATPVLVTVAIADNEASAFGSGSFVFSRASYQVTEGEGTVLLTVNRLGGTKNTVTVSYTTTNGTAISSQDYTITNGTLTFEPNESSKTFSIPISTDTYSDSGEYFTVTLSNAQLGDPNVTSVTIYD